MEINRACCPYSSTIYLDLVFYKLYSSLTLISSALSHLTLIFPSSYSYFSDLDSSRSFCMSPFCHPVVTFSVKSRASGDLINPFILVKIQSALNLSLSFIVKSDAFFNNIYQKVLPPVTRFLYDVMLVQPHHIYSAIDGWAKLITKHWRRRFSLSLEHSTEACHS